MVLKAIFISRRSYRITGLDSRRNAGLAAAISYLAHERWAAGRRIPAEAWRNCVGFVNDEISADLHHLLETGDPTDREAAALVLASDGDPRLADLRGRLEGEIDAIGAARSRGTGSVRSSSFPSPSTVRPRKPDPPTFPLP